MAERTFPMGLTLRQWRVIDLALRHLLFYAKPGEEEEVEAQRLLELIAPYAGRPDREVRESARRVAPNTGGCVVSCSQR